MTDREPRVFTEDGMHYTKPAAKLIAKVFGDCITTQRTDGWERQTVTRCRWRGWRLVFTRYDAASGTTLRRVRWTMEYPL